MSPAGLSRTSSRRLARAGISVWLSVASLLGVGLSAPGLSRAQPAPPRQTDARAISLFKEGRTLMEKGQYAEACGKLEESLHIDPGMGTLYNLSDCYEHIGRMASAWAGFRDVAAAADAAGQGARAQAARERAALLEPKLSKIRISVSKAAAEAGVEVQRNGVGVGRLLWGTDVPVDPGTYLISASAPGRAPWSVTAAVEGPGKVAAIEIPDLAKVKAVSAPPAPPRHAALLDSEGKSAVPVLLLGGLTAVGIGGGTGLFVLSSSKQGEALRLRGQIPKGGSDRDNACLATPQPASCADLESTANSAALLKTLSVGSFVLGGVGVVGMVVYLLMPAPSSRAANPPASSIRVLPAVGTSSGGLLAVGAF